MCIYVDDIIDDIRPEESESGPDPEPEPSRAEPRLPRVRGEALLRR
jgi:hypothetical protein